MKYFKLDYIFNLCIIMIFILPVSVLGQDTWVQKDSVNGQPRSSAASFVMDGEGFVVGGLDILDFSRKMYSYDVDQNDWDKELSIGGVNGSGLNRGGAIAFSINDKAYVGLGQGNTAPYYNDLWEYDPATESWSQKASFIGSPRRQAVAFEIDDLAYVGTGQSSNGYEKDFYSYDGLTNTWTQLADFGGTARKGAVGFRMGGQAYVGTGDDGIYTNDFWQYQPVTDTWLEKATLPATARTGACGWGMFPTAFIACGYDNTLNYKKDVWEYNYFADVWVQRSDFLGPKRTNANAFVINNVAYLGLGYNGNYLDDFYAYTPILSTDTYSVELETLVYPNPTINNLNISLKTKISNDVEVTILDCNGKVCHDFSSQMNSNTIHLDFNLVKGVYFYILSSEETDVNLKGKFIVQ